MSSLRRSETTMGRRRSLRRDAVHRRASAHLCCRGPAPHRRSSPCHKRTMMRGTAMGTRCAPHHGPSRMGAAAPETCQEDHAQSRPVRRPRCRPRPSLVTQRVRLSLVIRRASTIPEPAGRQEGGRRGIRAPESVRERSSRLVKEVRERKERLVQAMQLCASYTPKICFCPAVEANLEGR